MNKFLGAGAALLLTTGLASAGGLDRSGQGIGAIFEDGDYAELSFGYVMPNVSGTAALLGGASSGDMATDYLQFGFAVKTDLNDRLSLGLIYDQPFGAAIDYTNADPAYAGGVPPATASISSSGITVLGLYRFNENISVYAGPRIVSTSAEIDLTAVNPIALYDYAKSTDVGYVVGAAYEIPDIALRAALTYSSATTHQNDFTVGGFPGASTNQYTMPQSVNLDFQTGIAANTLLLASVRWAEWTKTEIQTNSPLGTIDYDNDSLSYSLGVARRFNDQLAGVIRVSYEAPTGNDASNLAPTDGSLGVTLGAIYNFNEDTTITAGISYVKLGDATTEGLGAEFTGNSALGVGVKVGFNF